MRSSVGSAQRRADALVVVARGTAVSGSKSPFKSGYLLVTQIALCRDSRKREAIPQNTQTATAGTEPARGMQFTRYWIAGDRQTASVGIGNASLQATSPAPGPRSDRSERTWKLLAVSADSLVFKRIQRNRAYAVQEGQGKGTFDYPKWTFGIISQRIRAPSVKGVARLGRAARRPESASGPASLSDCPGRR